MFSHRKVYTMRERVTFFVILAWLCVTGSRGQGCVPVDCVMSDWSQFSHCSGTCQDAIRLRTRTIITPELCGGKCHHTKETSHCSIKCCPVDCTYSEWSAWDDCQCSMDCEEPGMRHVCHRRRTNAIPNTCGGYCDDKLEDKKCGRLCCYQDCVLGEWMPWSTCNAQCEQRGATNRTKSVLRKAKCGGQSCDFAIQVRACTGDCCPADCVAGKWSHWSHCYTGCNAAFRNRTRVLTPPVCGGKECSDIEKFQKQPCKNTVDTDCKVRLIL